LEVEEIEIPLDLNRLAQEQSRWNPELSRLTWGWLRSTGSVNGLAGVVFYSGSLRGLSIWDMSRALLSHWHSSDRCQIWAKRSSYFGLVLFPSLFFLGIITLHRVLQTALEDWAYTCEINRIRHYYIELAPEMGRYLIHSTHDDMPGALEGIGIVTSGW
jgi:hypothetical protein